MASSYKHPHVHIYAMADPRTDTVRYVGITQYDLSIRLSQHVSEARKNKQRRKNRRTNWIRYLLSLGIKPSISLLEKCSMSDWKERERYWIEKYRADGADLVNGCDGGTGVLNPTPETLAKMSAIKIGKTPWNKGVPMSEAQREKCRQASERRWANHDERERFSRIFTGRKLSPSTIEKMKQYVPTAETRARISSALLGRPGKKHTMAQRIARSIAMKKRLAENPHERMVLAARVNRWKLESDGK